MKKHIIIKLLLPPAIAAFIWTAPRRDRNSRSVKMRAVSQKCEATIGNAMASISRKPPGVGDWVVMVFLWSEVKTSVL
jgi:hypothetical protein